MRRLAIVPAVLSLVLTALVARADDLDIYPDHDLHAGGVHFHTAYSDGAPHTRPADAYAAGKDAGMEFMAVTEHSEWLSLPVEADEDCLDPTARPAGDCVITTPDGIDKWNAHGQAAAAATGDGFLALRGFEWSSPTQGHVVVLGSANHENAYLDGGPATMGGFYQWLQRDPALGGGADAIAIFAHPGREELKFEDFRYDPAVDDEMVGVEVFNRAKDREYFVGGLAQALDNGWHTGAIGSADDHGPSWGRSDRARTVVVVPEGTPWTAKAVYEAHRARRFYATHKHTLQLRFHSEGREMGSRIEVPDGTTVPLAIEAYDPVPDGSPIVGVDLFTNEGRKILSEEGPFQDNRVSIDAGGFQGFVGEHWYVVKVRTADGRNAFSSPIWIRWT